MDKLIVTIIAIAITAATLYMSTDYLSNFYNTSHSRAKAQAWIAEAAQITAAARQAGYLASGSDDWSAGTATYLVPTYLSSLPRHSGSYVFSPCYLNGGNTSCPRNNTDATMIMAAVETAQVCEQIQLQANRGSTTLTKYTVSLATSGYTIAKNAGQQFACAWFDLNGNNQYDVPPTDNYYFLQRVFMDR